MSQSLILGRQTASQPEFILSSSLANLCFLTLFSSNCCFEEFGFPFVW